MQSLRARLVAGVVAVAALGLIILAGVTYAEQRSFQLDRIDQQVHAAVFPVSGMLDRRAPTLPSKPVPDRDDEHGPGHDDNFPYGTYGERRDASGATVATLPLTRFGQTAPTAPKLPKNLSVNKIVSVSAGGSGNITLNGIADAGGPRLESNRNRGPALSIGELTGTAVPIRDAAGNTAIDGTVEVLIPEKIYSAGISTTSTTGVYGWVASSTVVPGPSATCGD